MLHKRLLFVIIFLSLILFSPAPVQAQNLVTQKEIISSFKTPAVNQYFPFPESGCTSRLNGDANCDNVVDLFDLSLWQLEFNNQKGLRSDFNNDRLINLSDFSIWKDNYSPAVINVIKQTSLFQDIKNVFQDLLSKSVLAQQNSLAPSNLRNSYPFISLNQTAIIFNQNQNGTSSQISFDSSSNPASSLILNSEGNTEANSTFFDSGDQIVTTSQDEMFIQTLKKIEGPVAQFFKDSDDNILAIKSWTSLPSLEQGDPPIAVTLPARNNNLLTLTINPNGSSVVIQTDNKENVINLSSYKSNGTYYSQDNRYQIETEASKSASLSKIEMTNNLGGRTSYNFYKSGLFAIVQTDAKGQSYIAKPLDAQGSSWSFDSEITDDPIKELGSNTPSPQEIIQFINYYQSLPINNSAVNFQDGFGSSDKISSTQIILANEILKNSNSPLPESPQSQTNSGTFLIKAAFAAGTASEVAAASAASIVASGNITEQSQIGIGNNQSNVTVLTNGAQNNQILNPQGQIIASNNFSAQSRNASGQQTEGANLQANSGAILNFTSSVIRTGTGTPLPVEISGPTTCFLAGTLISTPNGQIAIEKLRPGDKVYSYNEKTGQKEISDFKVLDINFVDKYLVINDKIQTTTYHPFYVSNPTSGLLSLVKAGKLKTGNLMVDESNKTVSITSIKTISKKQTVYNLLSVSPNDNFYAEGILVHNYQKDNYSDGRVNNDTSTDNSSGGFDDNGISHSIQSNDSGDPSGDSGSTGAWE